MSSEEAVLQQLREQTKWLRLIGLQALKPLIPAVLKTEKQKIVYELTDGKRTVRDVAAAAGVGTGTVAGLWAEWITLGLCVEVGHVAGRAQHLTSLAALGYEFPSGVRSAEASTDKVAQRVVFSGRKPAEPGLDNAAKEQ